MKLSRLQNVYMPGICWLPDGNISVRHNNEIAITPSGKAKAFITSDDIARMNLDGRMILGNVRIYFG